MSTQCRFPRRNGTAKEYSGHAILSAGLVKQIRKAVTQRRMAPDEAAKILARPCYCGIFNLTRAEEMLAAEKELTQ